MEPAIIGAIGIGVILLLIAFHVPVGIAMAMAGLVFVTIILAWGPAISLLGTEPSSILASRELFVIPLFLLMGNLANASGLSSDIYRLAYALMGHWRGGLAMATIGGCAGFGAICGSSVATAATMARVSLPEMLERRYSPALATGSIAAGGTLGILIPPSIILVLYAYLTEQLVIDLFIAAIIPGLIAVLLHFVAIAIYVRAVPNSAHTADRIPWRERLPIIVRSLTAIGIVVVVTGGIYAGVFNVNEAAGVGATAVLAVAVYRRSLNWRALRLVLVETASNTAMIYLLIIGASIATYLVSLSRLPGEITSFIQASGLPPLAIIALLLVMYLVLGSIFETTSSMILTLPFVFPIVTALGYDPIWWGVVNVMVIEIGLITPPIGLNVFVLHGMARDIPMRTIFAGVLPFFGADLVRLSIITLFPVLALWLPSTMG